MYGKLFLVMILVALAASDAVGAAAVSSRTLNDGQLILQDVPAIPERLKQTLKRYQNVRSGSFRAWTADGESILITTRFGDTTQLHRVDQAGGARFQLTFFDEPIGQVSRRPKGHELAFTMDAGGSEFAQIFLLDPATGESRMLSDGESRNGALQWSTDGRRLAFQSTRRNGVSNDIWVLDPSDPASAQTLVEVDDGAWWAPVAWSRDSGRVLVQQYVGSTESRIYVVDADTGELRPVAGEGERSRNLALAFNADGSGIYYLTDRGSEFARLAYRGLHEGALELVLTEDIPWDINGFVLSEDGSKGAFVANEEGYSVLYLFDPSSQSKRRVDSAPSGIVSGLAFSPSGDRLAMSVNSPKAPSDAYVMAVESGEFTRWTFSEVGGLAESSFVEPELVRYPTFDTVDGRRRTIPAFVYKPRSDGPHPVVIRIHGGPEGQYRPFFNSTYQMWVARLGAAVIAPNVRGSAGYGKSFLKLDNGRLREDSVKDIGALLDWIGEQPDLDASRVAVIGGSYGGYMVLASATHYSPRLAAAIDIVGISNFVTFLKNTQSYRRDLRRFEYGDERDPAMAEFLQSISPANHVDRIKVPLMVVQGENDPRVPVTESEQIVEAVRGAGQSVWYIKALDEGHGFRKKRNSDVYQQAVVLFLEENLQK